MESKATEQSVDNQVFNKAINGRIELVLERNDELMVVDLKFSSIGTYRDKVKNGMDIQLMMYANMLAHEGDRKSTRLNSSHVSQSRMPSSA